MGKEYEQLELDFGEVVDVHLPNWNPLNMDWDDEELEDEDE